MGAGVLSRARLLVVSGVGSEGCQDRLLVLSGLVQQWGYGEKNDNQGSVIYSMAVAFAGDWGIPQKKCNRPSVIGQ